MTSAVLLQRFLTGLRPEINCQLLLWKKPADFVTALADAVEIEYAFRFNGGDDSVHSVAQPSRKSEPSNTTTLQSSLEALTKRLESLETTFQMSRRPSNVPQYSRRSYTGGRAQGQ